MANKFFARLKTFGVLVILALVVACNTPNSNVNATGAPPKFSREQAIAKAREQIATILYLHGGEVKEIQSIEAESMTRAEAFQKIGQPLNGDANGQVWFVTVKAPFWSLSPPFIVEGETGYRKAKYQGDEHFYIFDLETGEQEMNQSKGKVVGEVKFP